MEKARAALFGAVRDAFADMAFLDVAPGVARPLSGDTFSGAVDLLLPPPVSILCIFPAALADKIADSLFTDRKTALEDRIDCLLEILNVVAGNFLTCRFGGGYSARPGLPRIVAEGGGPGGVLLAALDLDAEGIPFRVELRSRR